MSRIQGFLFCASFALSSVFAGAVTVTPKTPELKDGCYQISSAAELYGFAAIANGTDGFVKDSLACGKLTKDIVVNENVLDAEGNLNVADTANFATWTPLIAFTGSIDGQGHSITGLYFNDSLQSPVGLIGSTNAPYNSANREGFNYPEVTVKNLRVQGSYFRGKFEVGGIVGHAYSNVATVLDNVSFDGVVVSGRFAGGLIGGSTGGDGGYVVRNSFNEGSVFAGSGAGGIVGGVYYMNRAWIVNSYNLGTVTSDSSSGGIVGEHWSYGGALVNVMNLGEVKLDKQETSIDVKSIVGEKGYALEMIDNVFYVAPGRNEHYGTAVTAAQLADGSVASLMHAYDYAGFEGSVWGQDVGTDSHPVLTGEVKNATFGARTVTFDTHGGENIEIAAPKGFAVRIPDIERAGYENLGWFGNPEFKGDTLSHVAAADTDVTVWGKFKAVASITLNTNGGTVDSGMVEKYTEGLGAKLPKKVSRDGYVFVGWYAEEDFSGNRVQAVDPDATGAQVFYARWYKMKTPAKDDAGCYVIKTAPELYGFAAIVNGTAGYTRERSACAGLANDIVVNSDVLKEDGTLKDAEAALNYIPWNPIDSFAGVFDGNGHVVSGLFYADSAYYASFGFFAGIGGTADKFAELKNFGLVDSYFAVKADYFGAIAGRVVGVPFSVNYGSGYCAKFSGVYNESTLLPYADAQGAAGILGSINYRSTAHFENTYNRGLILGRSYNIAGILAHLSSNTTLYMSNCYSVWKSKSLMSRESKAFIAGNLGASTVSIENCYYLNTQAYREIAGTPAADSLFKNGTVTLVLRKGENGSVWGQNVGTDAYPNLSGKLENSQAAEYKVTFHTFEGNNATYFDSYVAGFSKALPEDVYMENASFMGWYDNPEFEGESVYAITNMDSGDKEYWAKLQRTFGVTYETNGGTIYSGGAVIYTEGVGLELPNDVRLDSNLFAGWYDNAELEGTPVTAITRDDSGDKTYYAAWFKLKMPELDETDNCYAISDAAELYGFAAYVNGSHGMSYWNHPEICGKLTADIVVNENVLKEDGTLDSANVAKFLPWEIIESFSGKFDGQGHKISGLYGVAAPKKPMAFFNEIYEGNYDPALQAEGPVVIKKVTLDDTYFSGVKNGVAGFVSSIKGARSSRGVNYPGAILEMDSCHFKGFLKSDSNVVGGFVANSSGTLSITNSTSDGVIQGYSNAGGFGGYLYGTISITNSVNSAKIVGGYSSTGGFVGGVSGTTTIMNCENNGEVVARIFNNNAGLVAGILGQSYGKLTFVQNHNAGEISGPSAYMAGLISDISGSGEVVIANNYNTGAVRSTSSNNTYVAGLISRVYYSDVFGIVANNYSIGEISRTNERYGAIDYVMALSYSTNLVFENNFVAPTVEGLDTTSLGIILPVEKFRDGTVADSLHNYVQKDGEGVAVENGITGTAWTQGDEYPVLVTKSEFALVLNLNGGKLENAPTTYQYGEGLVLPEPTRTGYDFKGWFRSANFQGSVVTEISGKDAGDKIFYAKWEPKEYKVTVKVNNGNWGVVRGLKENGIYKYGEEAELVAVADNGYVLSNWQDDVRLVSTQYRLTVVSDTTVTANFAPVNPESSSSSAESSSSAVSSSSEKSSSSSSKEPESSSSECKGKDCKDAIPAIAMAPSFRVTAMNRELQVSGARLGAAFALFDMQGRVLSSGRVGKSNFSIPVSRAGNYLVRIGRATRRVSVR